MVGEEIISDGGLDELVLLLSGLAFSMSVGGFDVKNMSCVMSWVVPLMMPSTMSCMMPMSDAMCDVIAILYDIATSYHAMQFHARDIVGCYVIPPVMSLIPPQYHTVHTIPYYATYSMGCYVMMLLVQIKQTYWGNKQDGNAGADADNTVGVARENGDGGSGGGRYDGGDGSPDVVLAVKTPPRRAAKQKNKIKTAAPNIPEELISKKAWSRLRLKVQA